jgi:threonine dehydratase
MGNALPSVRTSMAGDLLRKISDVKFHPESGQTGLVYSPKTSTNAGRQVFLKREDQQLTFSFKIRGAFNKMAHMKPSTIRHGVIAASAGNHAQGVAISANHFGVPATLVMPVHTPTVKIRGVQRLGAEVLLQGATFQDSYQLADRISKWRKLAFIHPYDDLDVIAGQAQIGVEILAQMPQKPAAVFVPVGGGGLLAGIAAAIKTASPATHVYGVEPASAASMTQAFRAGGPVALEKVGTFCDGAAVTKVGERTFALARKWVDGLITVTTQEICSAIVDVFSDHKTALEPAGALAVAGINKLASQRRGPEGPWVAVASGANVDFATLKDVLRMSGRRAPLEPLGAYLGEENHVSRVYSKKSIRLDRRTA